MKRDQAEINRDKKAAIRRRTCLILFLSLFIYPLSAVLSWSNTQACRSQCTYSLRHDNNNRAGTHIPVHPVPWQTGSADGWHAAVAACVCSPVLLGSSRHSTLACLLSLPLQL